ncbi:MAG: zinc ABC transporter substrate-binding protein [Saprospiraceae bacterium]
MKRILLLTTIALAINIFYLQGQSKPKVVASASMLLDIAKNIAGDEVDLAMIVPIGGDPHIHVPTPANARLVNKANLILVNGLTFEGWMNELIENSGTTGKTITVTEGVEALKSLAYHNSADPHAWMVASNGIIYADNTRMALIDLLPEKAVIFNQNFKNYKKELLELHEYIKTQIATIPSEKRILITSHDAFQYYGRAYGLRLEAIMGISTDAEAQTSDIMRVNEAIRTHKVPSIFIESTINPKMMKQIAKDNDVSIGGQLFADSLGDEASPADTYINMLKSNTDTIVKALTGEKIITTEEESSNIPVYLGIAVFLLLAMYFGIKLMNK